ncbi:hypothetical protein M422DRAFT_273279 [Sphaerobolus stellatus SS14]|uniref:Uncharacterized protein n=1 Tax=Sphaerobolus stellatus (strain SS14) TaxID=990650 RepID=A0A0C9U9K5_SPHS4|nr:hypothetical protein M422DRAFT_273279 [Sphaerobolus stellatus SS14]
MSTRVEKGSQKFRPVLKSKARPSAMPASPDVGSSQPGEPSLSMPPPSTIPIRYPSAPPTPETPIKTFSSTQEKEIESYSSSQLSAQATTIHPTRPKPAAGNIISVGRGRSQTPAATVVATRPSQQSRPSVTTLTHSTGLGASQSQQTAPSSAQISPEPERE